MPAGSIKELVYLRTNKQKDDTDFSKYDVVITTYSTLTGRLKEEQGTVSILSPWYISISSHHTLKDAAEEGK